MIPRTRVVLLSKFAIGLLLSVSTAASSADIYECPDAGGMRYSDVKDPGCALVFRDGVQNEASGGKPARLIAVDDSKRRALRPAIHAAAQRNGVLPSLLEALIHVESGFRHDAVSVKGAMGLTQLMPATAQMLGVRNAFDAGSNIEGGARHLRDLLHRYRGDAKLALAAYNAGIGAVERYGAIPPFRETQDYVARVTSVQRQLADRAATQ